MNDSDKRAFAEMWAGVCSFFQNTPSKASLRLAFNCLATYPLGDVENALQRYLTKPGVKFAPRPGDIIELIDGNTQDSAALAWTKVQEAISRHGAYESICFDDPIINATLADMGGWVKLCACDEFQYSQAERTFYKRYQAYKNRPPKDYPKYLTGISEVENRNRGYTDQKIQLIGDEKRAQLVLENGQSKAKKLNAPVTVESLQHDETTTALRIRNSATEDI